MRPLLAFSAAIDLINEKIGYVCNLLVLAACVVSAGNAMIRYAFGYSSNAWLELQWYMFAVLVMFGALLHVQAQRTCAGRDLLLLLSERGQLWLDLIGDAVLPDPVLPAAHLSVLAVLHQAYVVNEMSSNAGGLIRWPIKFVLPVGFVMLALQGVSEVIKRIAALQGQVTIDAKYERPTAMIIARTMMPPLMFGGLVAGHADRLIRWRSRWPRSGCSFGFLAIHLGFFDLNFLQAIPGRVFGSVLSNDLLLAIPFFTFMGAILERCGLAEDMLDSMGQLFGPIRGGLGYSVIIVGFILGAITGTVAAQVIAMALISMPVMIRYGYNMRYITGVSGGLGHHHPAGAAVAGADRAGRPARQVGRRHVPRRLGPFDLPDRAVRRLHLPARHLQAGPRAAGAARTRAR